MTKHLAVGLALFSTTAFRVKPISVRRRRRARTRRRARRPCRRRRAGSGSETPRQLALRVEPVIGIIYTGPSYAADAAPVRPWLRVDHVPQAPFARNAGEEIDIVRALRVCRLHDAGIDVADLVLSHQRHRLRPQQPDPVELTLMQQHPQKSEIIARRRIEAAPAAPEFAPGWVRHRYRLQ